MLFRKGPDTVLALLNAKPVEDIQARLHRGEAPSFRFVRCCSLKCIALIPKTHTSPILLVIVCPQDVPPISIGPALPPTVPDPERQLAPAGEGQLKCERKWLRQIE